MAQCVEDGEPRRQFDTWEEMENHWVTECAICRAACSNCECEVARKDRLTHDCFERCLHNYKEHFEYIEKYED